MKVGASSVPVAAKSRSLSSLTTALGFGLSGAAFTLGSLMLARMLPMDAYGRLTLAVAVFNILGLLTPLGVDQLLLRRRIAIDGRLLALLLGSGTAMSALMAAAMHHAGGLRPMESLLTGLAIIAGGVVATASIGLRIAGKPAASMLLVISASFALLLAGTMALALGLTDTIVPLAIFATGNCLSAIAGWWMLAGMRQDATGRPDPIVWREALPMLGLVALGTLSLQIERIIIPIPLTLEDLARFGVLASVAIFPFRLLAAGVSLSLPPRLLVASCASERRGAVRREIMQLMLIFVPASLLLILLAPWGAALLTDGIYKLDRLLVLAACLNGASKVAMAFPSAMLKVSGSASDLLLVNGWGVIWLVLTFCGALVGAHYGLAGLILGASLASIVPTIFSFNLAWDRLGKG
ncbi:lipopolysaccharide biosynthesis protein [Sphingobium bisphenolivorans]|uniref:lipopolysaccharide biosynthesis protein n=1 Tax=Sphingobium bisphenolivorans TaxID=1335760 RepID=UPI0003A5B6CF|nr:hypothetical protein [Sphingobium bisphenolivorans]